jgi:hypothetical protein
MMQHVAGNLLLLPFLAVLMWQLPAHSFLRARKGDVSAAVEQYVAAEMYDIIIVR